MDTATKDILEALTPWADAAPDAEVVMQVDGEPTRFTRRGIIREIEGKTPRGRRWTENWHRMTLWHERLQKIPMPMTMYMSVNCPNHPIVELKVEPCGLDGYWGCVRPAGSVPPGEKADPDKHFFSILRPGMDCFPTLDEAVADAERRRAEAVAKLQAGIDRYNAIDFRNWRG